MKRFLASALLGLLAFWASSCGHAPTPLTEDGIYAERPPDSIAGDGSREFQLAQSFDKLLRGKLDDASYAEMRRNCSAHPHVFCFSIQNISHLRRIIDDKTRVRTPAPQKAVLPVRPVFTDGKVTNLTALRRAEVDQLLKGFLKLKYEEITQVGKAALSSKKCPNNAAVASAASLEDFLPEQANWSLIAELYTRGGVCAKKAPIDREHFYTRASLFWMVAGQDQKAYDTLLRVNPTDAFAGRSAFWRYRLAKKLGKSAVAEKAREWLFNRQPFSFHAAYLAKQLSEDFAGTYLADHPVAKARSTRFKKANTLIEQAELLKKYGFDFSAAAIVDWTLSRYPKLEPEARLHLVAQGDPPAQVAQVPFILLSGRVPKSRKSLELMFPRPFYELFVRESGNHSPYLLMAVARKESRFNPLAVSPANAQGMMQIAPDTAQKMTGDRNINLFDPTTSVRLAASHLERDLDRFNQNLAHAIGAYNAGEDAVQVWLKRYPTSDPVLWIDLIPYRETRDYTGLVLSYYYWYRRLYDSAALSVLP